MAENITLWGGEDGPLTVRVAFGAEPGKLLARLAQVALALECQPGCRDARAFIVKAETDIGEGAIHVHAVVPRSTTPEKMQGELLALAGGDRARGDVAGHLGGELLWAYRAETTPDGRYQSIGAAAPCCDGDGWAHKNRCHDDGSGQHLQCSRFPVDCAHNQRKARTAKLPKPDTEHFRPVGE